MGLENGAYAPFSVCTKYSFLNDSKYSFLNDSHRDCTDCPDGLVEGRNIYCNYT